MLQYLHQFRSHQQLDPLCWMLMRTICRRRDRDALAVARATNSHAIGDCWDCWEGCACLHGYSSLSSALPVLRVTAPLHFRWSPADITTKVRGFHSVPKLVLTDCG